MVGGLGPALSGKMYNLYSTTRNQDAIRRLFAVTRDSTGNLPPIPGVFPDYPAPIVRQDGAEREMAMSWWGMPSSQKAMMDATEKRTEKLETKGKAVDFRELLRLEPDTATTKRPQHIAHPPEAVARA